MAFDKKILIFLLLLLLPACTSNVTKVEFTPAIEMPEDAAPAPLLFRGAKFLIPPGEDIGTASASSGYCSWPKVALGRTVLRRALDQEYLREGFKDTLESSGYDVVTSLKNIFEEEEDDLLRAEYTINAKIRATELNLCENDTIGIFSPRAGTHGEVYISVDWSIYDPVKRSVAYKTTTEGYAKLERPNHEGLTLMLHEAFEMATHNLGADEGFYNLIVRAIAPPKNYNRKQENFENRRAHNPSEPVSLPAIPLSTEPFTKNIDAKRKNAVTVQKIGHGSGFFISREGHIITNAHVVGDSIRTGVLLAGAEKRIPAEVLRVDRARDVALLKLDEIPEGYTIALAPIRPQSPGVGEDVYVLGSPAHAKRYQDTLTHGIVSAVRKIRFFGHTQNFIQSDAEIHGGNSGGPMYDKNGNIIGISVSGALSQENGIGNGLNFFIPIAEALSALDITTNNAHKTTISL